MSFQAIGHDITDRQEGRRSDSQSGPRDAPRGGWELTAMIAHEVNQPLCAILSNAEAAETLLTLKEPPLPEVGRILAEICKEDLRAEAR
mgnify:CR=1 FL=1